MKIIHLKAYLLIQEMVNCKYINTRVGSNIFRATHSEALVDAYEEYECYEEDDALNDVRFLAIVEFDMLTGQCKTVSTIDDIKLYIESRLKNGAENVD